MMAAKSALGLLCGREVTMQAGNYNAARKLLCGWEVMLAGSVYPDGKFLCRLEDTCSREVSLRAGGNYDTQEVSMSPGSYNFDREVSMRAGSYVDGKFLCGRELLHDGGAECLGVLLLRQLLHHNLHLVRGEESREMVA